MPFDDTPEDDGGGGGDPHHNPKVMQAVANTALCQLLPEMSRQLDQCPGCTLAVVASRAIGMLLYKYANAETSVTDDEVIAALRTGAEQHKRDLIANGGGPIGPMPTVVVRDDPDNSKLH